MIAAAIGASAALVGFVLVFLGVLVASFQGALGEMSRKTLRRFKWAGWIAVLVFLLGLATIAMGMLWLARGGSDALYGPVLVLFFAELLGLTVVAIYTTWRVLLR